MSELITKETADTLVKGAKSIGEVVAGVGTDLANEAINLFILESTLAILKFAAVFIVFYIVKKYFDTMQATADQTKIGLFKALKATSLVATIVYFTANSIPHMTQIGKALVAPKIFLIEKANQLRK